MIDPPLHDRPTEPTAAKRALRGARLTAREVAALRARDEAETDAEAASALGVTVNTLRQHLKNARSKLYVRTTHQAIRKLRAA